MTVEGQIFFELSHFLDERKIAFLQIAAAKGCKEACYWYNKNSEKTNLLY